MRSESTESMMPLRLARMTAPESRAVTPSMPVPTNGASATSRGTDCRWHVGAHQRTIGVIVLEERHERGGNGDELLRRDVDVVHLGLRNQNEVALTACVDQIFGHASVGVEIDVGLRDGVAILFPGREVKAERLKLCRALPFCLETIIQLDRLADFQRIALPQAGLPGVRDGDVLEHTAVLDLAVRRLDKAVLVNTRKTR